MIKRLFFFICLVPGASAYALVPLSCDPDNRAQIEPFLKQLKKISSPEQLSKIREAKRDELGHFRKTYGKFIARRFLEGSVPKHTLIDAYQKAGLHYVNQMTQDLIEDLWVDGLPKRCRQIAREHDEPLAKDGFVGETQVPHPSRSAPR